MKILNPFNDTSSTAYKVVIKIIYGLIFVTLFTIVVDTLPALSDGTRRFLRFIDLLIIGAFTVEYFMRFAAADGKVKYFFSISDLLISSQYFRITLV